MKKTITAIVIVLVIISGIGYVATRSKKNNIKEVRITNVSKGEIKSYLSTTAVIKSKQSKDYFGSQLKISKVNYKVGDRVKQGDIIVAFDISDLNLQLKQAQIQYDNSQLQRKELLNQRDELNRKIADLDAQITQLENSKNPAEQVGLSTLKQQRAALQPISEEKMKQMDNSVSLAKASLDSINSKIATVRDGIKADFDGVITTLNAVEGAVGNPAQVLVTLQDINNLKAIVSLGKYDAKKIVVGQDVIVKNSGKEYKGKISFVNPSATKTQGISGGDVTLNAEIDILDRVEDLKIDFDVDVDILLGSVDNVLKVPIETLRTDKTGRNTVLTTMDGLLKENEVKVGLQSDTQAEIVEGLNENDKVVLNPTGNLKEGDKVKEQNK